jgi:class 3 adenylate cyclase
VQPDTNYASLDGDRIGYQVFGHGPPDVVTTIGSFSHMDLVWEDPGVALYFRSLGSFSRVIRFDRRGTGVSDRLRLELLPPWESWAEELAVVLDAAGSQQAAIIAQLDAGPMALFFAATRPERTSALVLVNTTARWAVADDYPIGLPGEVLDARLRRFDQLWGTEAMAASLVPSRADDAQFRRWWARLQRATAPPGAMAALQRALAEIDARPLLALIQAPTLILHRRDSAFVPYSHGQYLADHIAGAKLVELPGTEGTIVWETPQLALDHIEEFLTGARHGQDPSRVLATVLFTDIVGSTQQARRLGDRRWRELLNVHDELARRLVEQAGGRLVKTTGDGILATFDGPGRGIHCAIALRDQLRGIEVQIRAGLHVGEVELRDGDVGGMAVHIAARVMAAAQPGEILVSRTVRDLVVGSDLVLDDRGTRPLKGVGGDWQLFAVHRGGDPANH